VTTSEAPADLASAGAPGGPIVSERARIVAETLRSPSVLANPKVPTAQEIDQLVSALTDRSPNGPPRARPD
jgi:hypothetical protein